MHGWAQGHLFCSSPSHRPALVLATLQMDQMVGLDGELKRFCQQCGRFHPLTAFDENKRSCRERLARHNERRRRRGNEPTAANSGGNNSSRGAPAADMDGMLSCGVAQDEGWSRAGRSMADLAPASFHPSLSIWDQRQLQFQQALMAEQMGQPAMVDLQPLRMEVSHLPKSFDHMHGDFAGELGTAFAAVATSDSNITLVPMTSRLAPQMLAMSDANLISRASFQPASMKDSKPSLDPSAQRKAMSWPLTHLRLEESHPEQLGLITGSSGALAMHHTYTDEAMLMMRSGCAALPELQRVAALDGASGDIRVLGENQTLDSIWENIMLIDDDKDHVECS